MTINFRTLAIALAILVSAPVAAQMQAPKGEYATTKNQRVERAEERCRQNHGVDCNTPRRPEGMAAAGAQPRGSSPRRLAPPAAGAAQPGAVAAVIRARSSERLVSGLVGNSPYRP